MRSSWSLACCRRVARIRAGALVIAHSGPGERLIQRCQRISLQASLVTASGTWPGRSRAARWRSSGGAGSAPPARRASRGGSSGSARRRRADKRRCRSGQRWARSGLRRPAPEHPRTAGATAASRRRGQAAGAKGSTELLVGVPPGQVVGDWVRARVATASSTQSDQRRSPRSVTPESPVKALEITTSGVSSASASRLATSESWSLWPGR